MKITHNKVGRNLDLNDSGKVDKAKDAKAGKGAAGAEKADALADLGSSSKVSVSSRAQDMKKAKEVANAAPDVDETKVARLQKLIDEGKYKVDAKDIADKMVDEHLSWE